MKTFWRWLLPTVLIAPFPIVIALIIAPVLTADALMLLLIPGAPMLMGGIAYMCGMKEFDEKAAQFENVIDLLRGYPTDWEIEDWTEDWTRWVREGGIKKQETFTKITGELYRLHGNLMVVDRMTYYESGESKGQPKGKAICVVVRDTSQPVKKGEKPAVIEYEPNWEYQSAIRSAIKDMRQFRELKLFVGVALDAEEKRTPADKAQQALEDFSERADMGDPSALAARAKAEAMA